MRKGYGKGFTIIELITTVIILGILAGVVIPTFQKAIKRAAYREVKTMAELAKAGASYYDLKYGIANLPVATYQSSNQPLLWQMLNVDRPPASKCDYRIEVDADTFKKLIVYSPPGGTWIFKYNFQAIGTAGAGVKNNVHADVKYLPIDLPDL